MESENKKLRKEVEDLRRAHGFRPKLITTDKLKEFVASNNLSLVGNSEVGDIGLFQVGWADGEMHLIPWSWLQDISAQQAVEEMRKESPAMADLLEKASEQFKRQSAERIAFSMKPKPVVYALEEPQIKRKLSLKEVNQILRPSR